MTRRVVIGKQADGSFDLRTSLAGFDALTGNIDDPNVISFSAQWTDQIIVHQIGNVVLSGNPTDPENPSGMNVFFPALTVIPYVEIRNINGNTVFDDHAVGESTALCIAVKTNKWQLARRAGSLTNAFYVVLKDGGLVT